MARDKQVTFCVIIDNWDYCLRNIQSFVLCPIIWYVSLIWCYDTVITRVMGEQFCQPINIHNFLKISSLTSPIFLILPLWKFVRLQMWMHILLIFYILRWIYICSRNIKFIDSRFYFTTFHCKYYYIVFRNFASLTLSFQHKRIFLQVQQ